MGWKDGMTWCGLSNSKANALPAPPAKANDGSRRPIRRIPNLLCLSSGGRDKVKDLGSADHCRASGGNSTNSTLSDLDMVERMSTTSEEDSFHGSVLLGRGGMHLGDELVEDFKAPCHYEVVITSPEWSSSWSEANSKMSSEASCSTLDTEAAEKDSIVEVVAEEVPTSLSPATPHLPSVPGDAIVGTATDLLRSLRRARASDANAKPEPKVPTPPPPRMQHLIPPPPGYRHSNAPRRRVEKATASAARLGMSSSDFALVQAFGYNAAEAAAFRY